MRLFEYEGKEIFSRYGIPVPRSRLVHDPPSAVSAARELGLPAVIKAQVLAGGRGKAGGVVVARTDEEVEAEARRILSFRIGGEATRARHFHSMFSPMQAAGDHQMQNEPKIAIEADGDAFADSAQLADAFAFGGANGWIDGTKEEWTRDADLFERLAEDAFFERFDVDDDVGELGHSLKA